MTGDVSPRIGTNLARRRLDESSMEWWLILLPNGSGRSHAEKSLGNAAALQLLVVKDSGQRVGRKNCAPGRQVAGGLQLVEPSRLPYKAHEKMFVHRGAEAGNHQPPGNFIVG